MIREYAYDPEFLFYLNETECDPSHPTTTPYENITNITESDLDADSIEAMVEEFFR